MHYTIHTDGGARGNPGPAGAGVVIESEGKKIELKKYLGIKTNNQAEYEALIMALEHILEIFPDDPKLVTVYCFLDSELVVKQLNGQYKVKNLEIKNLVAQVQSLSSHLHQFEVKHIPREKNQQADKLVNLAIDEG